MMNCRTPIRLSVASVVAAYVLCQMLGGSLARGASPVWPPAGGPPMTRWGKQVSVDKPVLPEYPRPQLVRRQWLNLNGLWDYGIAPRDADRPATYAGKILVPFPVESVLSQVNRRIDENSRLWYRRTLSIPAAWSGRQIRLHFGAVDWETTVWFNGKLLGTHRGGYDNFSFDITDALTSGGPQELVVSVWDPTEGGQPHGKQCRKPAFIFYTPTTGIWQTVWLEPLPPAHVERLKMIPDVDGGRLHLTVDAAGNTSAVSVEAVVTAAGHEVARAVGKPGQSIALPIPRARLWWPDSPFLYDLQVTLKRGGEDVDTVTSYFGMRKISLGTDAEGVRRILLNNRFVLHNGMLDQGFWPDGLYTAPSDEALRYDIEMTRKLGFNMSRKHLKVEPDRWYYWADRLGLLVWQDMPCAMVLSNPKAGKTIPDMPVQFEWELRRMIEGRFNHPSIVMWVLFNEGMGLAMGRNTPETPSEGTRALLRRMVDAARQEDATRLINHESGAGGGAWQGKNPWDVGLGDIVDFHCYGKSDGPLPEKYRAAVIGEYGYGVSPTSALRHIAAVKASVSGLVLTQITDVENESNNGALTYDRRLKGRSTPEQIQAQLREAFRPWNGPGPDRPDSPAQAAPEH
ncbi:MAG: sugar-binding domain-containing protein [Planctomycetota bacterium]